MIVCPVCEHSQAQGSECEVCGRGFGPATVVPETAAPPEGLERTALAVADGGGIAPLVDLEPTFHAPAQSVADVVPDLEATAAGPVDLEVPPAPDVERTEYVDVPVDDAFAIPALPVCRYCRTPATADERICARCGMRLPTFGATRGTAAPDEDRRCSCGLLVAPGAGRCPSCGSRIG